jgi:3-oxoacyl-[acyl-carrier-protein] synthase-1
MAMMRRAVVTGLGFITSIGNNRAAVLENLRQARSGIEIHPGLDQPGVPYKLAGTIKGFDLESPNREAWKFPGGLTIPRTLLRGLPPHGVFAYAAMQEAIADAGLPEDQISHERTGLMCASAGSTRMLHGNVEKMLKEGIHRCHPNSVSMSIAGTLNFNLVAAFKIRGPATGFVDACSSSAIAFGHALDLVRYGRQDIVFVVGAEDCDIFSILPFGSCRALTSGTDPSVHPCAFDVKRDGFAATGGAAVLVVEELEHAQERGARIYAEAAGWGQTSDGYHVMAPEPNGEGLERAMEQTLHDAQMSSAEIDYVNAHATATPLGDPAECRALKKVFGKASPLISSTKSQTGHALSMAGALEAAICCLAIREQFTPVSMNITELDPACEGLRIVTNPIAHAPRAVLSNSSAFGGANVSLALRAFEDEASGK